MPLQSVQNILHSLANFVNVSIHGPAASCGAEVAVLVFSKSVWFTVTPVGVREPESRFVDAAVCHM